MPMHERQLLREAIVAQLKGPSNDRTSAGERVFKTRQDPLRTWELPAISVYSVEEPVNEKSKSTAPRELERDLRVEIVGWVKATENVDDALDALALEIETAMDLDPNLRVTVDDELCPRAFDSILEGTSFAERLEGERPMGSVVLTYVCTYHTQSRLPLPTEPFELAGVTINVDGEQLPPVDPNPDDRPQDLVDIPQE
jgi:hypothetical protein